MSIDCDFTIDGRARYAVLVRLVDHGLRLEAAENNVLWTTFISESNNGVDKEDAR